MATDTHLVELERQHRTIELEIEAELAHPGADSLKVQQLKRRKLLLKDEIERLRHDAEASVH
jgi:hypothetical protein